MYLGFEYFEQLLKNYPEALSDPNSPLLWVKDLHSGVSKMKTDSHKERFCSIKKRGFCADLNASHTTTRGGYNWLSVSRGYKGLFNIKTPFDLQLYSSLIWELKPKTIIEFGSFQGGSAVWFADQLAASGVNGHVHSFELFIRAIHETAMKDPRISFHHANLQNISEINLDLLKQLPHPWLVVDDAHTNLVELIPEISKLLDVGDYFVIEDFFLKPGWTVAENLQKMTDIIESSNLVVDTKYADAFGYNVTCAPNGWLKKVEQAVRIE